MTYASLFADLTAPASSVPFVDPEIQQLTEQQRAALYLPFSQSAAIQAGAGSGKTKLLVERAVHLLRSGVAPHNIALISFTKKSAVQLAQRIKARLGPSQRRVPTCSTLHALALRICSRDTGVMLSTQDCDPEIIEQVRAALGGMADDLSDKDIATQVGRHREQRNFSSSFGLAAMVWMQALQDAGKEDFTSLIERAQPQESDKFQHILVDEAQDLSEIQRGFISRLMLPGASVWYVGDDDQSIYIFRGARTTGMRDLEVQNKLQLTLNWRCDRQIVFAANSLMRKSQDREAIEWQSASRSTGEVIARTYATAQQEKAAALEFARAAPDRVILGRTQRQLEALREAGAPCATVHEAKGLEWDGVWVLGCVQGLFPHILSDAEEERRLFYVAMTRARKTLVLGGFQRPSEASKKRCLPSFFLKDAGFSV